MSWILCLSQHIREKISNCISSETIKAVFWSQSFPLCFHCRSYTVFQFFLGKSKIQRFSVHFQLFELVCITDFFQKMYYSCSNRSFAYWRTKKPTMIASLCSFFALASSTSYNALFKWFSFWKSFPLIASCVFLSLNYFVTRYQLRSMIWQP